VRHFSGNYDVIIVGGGIIGLSSAYALIGQGMKVLLLESSTPGHKRGSSHGDSRMIRFDYEEPLYVEMAALAFKAWHDLGKRIGRPVFKETGICNLAPRNSDILTTIRDRLSDYELPFEQLTSQSFNQRFPQYTLPQTSEAIYQPDSAVLFADEAIFSLCKCIKEDGVDVELKTKVTSIELGSRNVEVGVTDGRYWSGGHLILAAGAWTSDWLEQFGLDIPLQVTRELVAYFAPMSSVRHEVGSMPNCIDYHTPDPFYCVPNVGFNGVKAGCHRTGQIIRPDDPELISHEHLVAVQNFISKRCVHLSRDPVSVDHCLYTNSVDYHFIIDLLPDYENVVLAAGFSGHGFKFGPVLGKILVGMLLKKHLELDTTLFALKRFDDKENLKARTIA